MLDQWAPLSVVGPNNIYCAFFSLNKLSVEMQISEHEAMEILDGSCVENKSKDNMKRKPKDQAESAEVVVHPEPLAVPQSAESLAIELSITKDRLESVTREMEGMRDEMDEMRTSALSTISAPKRIFALGFLPSVVLSKNHLQLLKWVTEVLVPKMKERMSNHQEYFRVIVAVSGIEDVGARTCPVFNRIEYCSFKWHCRTKITRTGRPRADLRLHCCTLCVEALGIICGHPLLRCPWIYEETWSKIANQ